jgi:hypothetical protein
LQRLYGNPNPTSDWLDARAHECKQFLQAEGIDTAWVDFETLICDFNVMRDGRYYPGRHLAAAREEIESLPEPWRSDLQRGWKAVVPERWRDIEPGIDANKMSVYRDEGVIIDTP